MTSVWLGISLLALLLPHNVVAETAEEKGLRLATKADELDTGWGDQFARLKMVLRNRHGETSERLNHSTTLEVTGDGDKSLIVFDTPKDVKGTAFLSHTHAVKPDDQWLYLPALKRVKRISSSNKSGPFVGSEFAYEDLASQEIEKYKYKFIKDGEFEGKAAYVIEQYPQYRHSGYKRQLVWLDKEIYRPLKVEFYDRKNALLKTLTNHEYKRYLDKYWRPDRMEMVNHLTGKSTTLYWLEYKFGLGLSDKDFHRNALKRAR